MATINWTGQALADLEAIGDFIAIDAPSFAQVFIDQIFAAVERLDVISVRLINNYSVRAGSTISLLLLRD
ncbi:type II toxin-antitoxin system RelE/ParE family toxin [Limnoraphis robusta Tam1]|jgi:transcription elongation GreA/GreB family factor|uniref:Type II toxin-antitoxin system RelE/ParE family toxin n=1 Tax=Limnoraphis robusta CCNP1315 TaxID=3110306 RepID=A0ABU5U6C9_9CYAN|nr:type II toxin-antitoxin system RelE/ParE family toxin [Limnoraphis robusta]MEA5500106.1 type II toxin-antitoxin system RelE/ParE family toxin [Limnoraphis robusta BA-68 BA1]MEA5522744.1 type II toxin-antitoxin system RelE/ParE family toxin [Limnoraphis robusta CCNP1315]MEA5540223.1 type II toxin-antitoxin system RelE/ParE family toxin [Limnoraphis robusta Tam1]MEA5543798.1 type II toxin-antitoxin system RelE/ParE family toxin [Limnoraphis robusta CCNP1324]